MSAAPLTAALLAYRYGLYLGEPAVAALLALRARRGKEDPSRLAERRGVAGRARPAGPLAWLHGASVGEALSLMGLVDGLIGRGFQVLLTTGTRSAADLIAPRLPPGAIHQYMPLDATRWIGRFLDHWRPDLALVAESEIWPNAVISLHARGVPLVLVNARMSARSHRGWARAPFTAKALMSRIALCLAQTDEDAARFSGLGARRVSVTGNLKHDSATPPVDERRLTDLRAIIGARPCWVAASTHAGEDAHVAAAHAALSAQLPGLLTIVAPRHPRRGAEAAARAEAHGLRPARRSQGGEPTSDVDVYVADTLGELGLFYRLGAVAFLGGSLAPRGGQNPIEASRLGAAILHGPRVENFADVYRALDEAGGAREVTDADALARAVGDLLADRGEAQAMARGAEAALAPFAGAVGRTLAALGPLIDQALRAGGG